MEIEIKTMEKWLNEGYNSINKDHKKWIKEAVELRNHRMSILSNGLNRTDTSILNYSSGRTIPNVEMRGKIVNIVGRDLLWEIENQFIITKYEH